MPHATRQLTLAAALFAAACGKPPSFGAQTPADASPQPRNTPNAVAVDTIVRGLEHPWGMAFLPDGRLLVTERPGRLVIITMDGTRSAPLGGVPAVYARGQGGLLDVALDPQFAENQLVYLSYAEPGPDGAGTSVARGRLEEDRLADLQVIYRQRPKVEGGGHYGSRLVFATDGNLFITQGDRMGYRDLAQDLTAGMGKIVRVEPDGGVPFDNPYVDHPTAQKEIWSYGHRNVQGAALHPATGQLWTVEHGARGGDELNHPEPGLNYGWPVITYGRDYSGFKIGEGVAKDGMEQPVYYWDPVIAPSGMIFYTGNAFPDWKQDLLIGSLSPGGLVRLELSDGRVTGETRYLNELRERFRALAQGPDGFVYVLTDSSDGKLLRVRPLAR